MSKNFVSYNDIETIIEKIKLELDKKAVIATKTKEEYEALSPAEKNNGTIYFITDYNEFATGNVIRTLVRCYYNDQDEKFYQESTFENEVTKGANYLYIDLNSYKMYIYDLINKEFISISGDSNEIDTTFTEASTRVNIVTGETMPTILGKIKKFFSDLKTVAFTGDYSDLTGQPTIPTVNNGTLTIQKNGTNVQTFTANQSSNATANIVVPTKVSELTNDSGFTSNAGTVTSVKVGTTPYDPSNGVVSLPAYPTGGSFDFSSGVGTPITVGKWINGFNLKLVVYQIINSNTTYKIYNSSGTDITSSANGAIPAGGKVAVIPKNIISGMSPILITGSMPITNHGTMPVPNKYVNLEFTPSVFTIYNISSESITLNGSGATIFVWYY